MKPFHTFISYFFKNKLSNTMELGVLEKATVFQLLDNFPTIYVTQKFITQLTGTHHLPLS
jgi:hypothetical protein